MLDAGQACSSQLSHLARSQVLRYLVRSTTTRAGTPRLGSLLVRSRDDVGKKLGLNLRRLGSSVIAGVFLLALSRYFMLRRWRGKA